MRSLQFARIPGSFAVCRLPAGSPVPSWSTQGAVFSVTATPEELSVVCLASQVPADIKHEGGWACFKLVGPFPFAETGILASFIQPLAVHSIPIFAVSTFDTDYVLVKESSVEATLEALHEAGHRLI
jgi:hypothetical protein